MDKNTASTDPVVETNVALLRSRSALGIEKYGTTLADSKAPLRDFLEHALLELLDGANYLQTAMHKIDAAPAPATPAGSVDTLEFRGLLGTLLEASDNDSDEYGAARAPFIAHIDAHTARAVAAANERAQIAEFTAKARLLELESLRDECRRHALNVKTAAPQQHAQAALSDEDIYDIVEPYLKQWVSNEQPRQFEKPADLLLYSRALLEQAAAEQADIEAACAQDGRELLREIIKDPCFSHLHLPLKDKIKLAQRAASVPAQESQTKSEWNNAWNAAVAMGRADGLEISAKWLETNGFSKWTAACIRALAASAASVPAEAVKPVGTIREGFEQAASAIAARALGWRNFGNDELADELLQCRAMLNDMKPAAPVPAASVQAWDFCPECGSTEIRYEEGNHKQCADCHQEWWSDVNYIDVVRKHLKARKESATVPQDIGRDAALVEVVSSGQRADEVLGELVVGKFYWIWIALDPDAIHEWENDFMPARFAGYDDNGRETWNFLDSNADEWPSRCTYHITTPPANVAQAAAEFASVPDAKDIAGKALQGLRMTDTEKDAQFTPESQRQMFKALVAIHGPVVHVVGDSIINEHGRFVSPKGRGFTEEEMRLVKAGTYAAAPQTTEKP